MALTLFHVHCSLDTLARRPDSHASLFIRLIDHLHLPDRVLTIDPRPALPPLDPIHKPLHHIPIRRPPVLSRTLTPRPDILLLSLRVLLRPNNLIIRIAIDGRRLDVDSVPDMRAHEIIQRDSFLRGDV